MSEGPKISIITACYNAEATIEQTIQSVLSQTYDNIEYIIVDGASTDGTMEIVNKYRNQIDIVISEPDKGIYDAFNKGVKVATGDLINFMNADDFFANERIVNEVANRIRQSPSIKGLYGNVKAIDENSGHWHFRGKKIGLEDFPKGEMYPHQSGFMRKTLFEEFEGFDTRYKILADIDFTIKTFKKYADDIVYLDLLIANFRLGGASTSLEGMKATNLEHALILTSHFGEIPTYLENIFKNQEQFYNLALYNIWLENLALKQNQVLENLISRNKKAVYIFGTKKIATYLYHNLAEHIEVKGFIDNDSKMQGELLHGLKIYSVNEILIDESTAIVISIENSNTIEIIKKQLIEKGNINKNIFVWKDLII